MKLLSDYSTQTKKMEYSFSHFSIDFVFLLCYNNKVNASSTAFVYIIERQALYD